MAAAAMALLLGTGSLRAGPVPIPNGSFESPAAIQVDTRIDSWQKTARPGGWDENAYGPWDQLTGLFVNPTPDQPTHILNCDGNQAIWLFASPEVGLFQDYDSTDWSSPEPSHAFDAVYEAGKSYELAVGIRVSAISPLPAGATMELSLYYRDAEGMRVPVAATQVTNTPTSFTNATLLTDFQVVTPTVNPGDAWAGKHVGVQILSTAPTLTSGYWDLDRVRLTATLTPTLTAPGVTDGQFGFLLHSEPGLRFEILAASDPTLPLAQWTSSGSVTNVAGSVPFAEPATSLPRFYRARQLP